MLSIAGSYNCVQFQGKLTTQTWENGNYFSPYGRNLGTKLFSWILTLLHVTHCRKLSLYAISRNTNQPNLTKWQNSSFPINFGPFGPNLGPKKFFSKILPLLRVRHCCKLSLYATSRKLMNQIWENGRKPGVRSNFGPFFPNLVPKPFFVF